MGTGTRFLHLIFRSSTYWEVKILGQPGHVPAQIFVCRTKRLLARPRSFNDTSTTDLNLIYTVEPLLTHTSHTT